MSVKMKRNRMQIQVMPNYSVGEEVSNSVTHALGAIAGMFATVLMMQKAGGNPLMIVACAIYGLSMVLLFSMSALYHAAPRHAEAPTRMKQILRIADHSTIFLLIAGTYTPFTLITLQGAVGWTIFGIVWGTALVGIPLNIISIERFKLFSMIGYIASGWCIVLAFEPLWRAMAIPGIVLLVSGGLCYTLGLIFYKIRSPYMHTIWHLFVLAGAVCHFLCIYYYVL